MSDVAPLDPKAVFYISQGSVIVASCPNQFRRPPGNAAPIQPWWQFSEEGMGSEASMVNTHDKYGGPVHPPASKKDPQTGHQKHSYKTYSLFIQNVESIHRNCTRMKGQSPVYNTHHLSARPPKKNCHLPYSPINETFRITFSGPRFSSQIGISPQLKNDRFSLTINSKMHWHNNHEMDIPVVTVKTSIWKITYVHFFGNEHFKATNIDNIL